MARCRVDCHRVNAGVLALGEGLRLNAAERPRESQTTEYVLRTTLKRRRNVTVVFCGVMRVGIELTVVFVTCVVVINNSVSRYYGGR